MKRRLLLNMLLLVAVPYLASADSTTSQLRITSGLTTITIVDGGPGDTNSAAGAINYSNSNFNGWSIAVAGGASDSPNLNPVGIDLFAVVSCESGACLIDNLVVEYTDQDFTRVVPLGGFSEFFSATIGAGSATETAWEDASNTPFGHGTLIGSIGPLGAPGGSESAHGGGPAAGSYSLTLQDTISHGRVNLASLDGNITAVPEPSSMLLFGTGLLALTALAKNKLRQRP